MKRILLLGFTFVASLSLFSLPLVGNATTTVGQNHNSTSDTLNDIISSTQVYDRGYITYKRRDSFNYINNTIKYSMSDNYLSSSGGGGNFEYSHGLNYIILGKFLIVPSSEAAGLLTGEELLAFRESNPINLTDKWIKIDTELESNKSYVKSIIEGYNFRNTTSAVKTFNKMIPLVNSSLKFTIKNYGSQKQYYLVSYSDRKILYTVKDKRVVSVRESYDRGLTSYLSMRQANFVISQPAAAEIK